jgi:glycosyltransferase involved in cell wall biosynthesis
MSLPLISIVVCTHNRANMLSDALASLANLHTNGQFDYEIVVVDNASTDATPQVVTSFSNTTSHVVHYALELRKGIAFARNCGVRAARGEWIAFFDDDQLADPHWLWELWAFTEDRKVLGVGGSVVLKLPDDCQRTLHPFVRMLLGEALHGKEPFAYSHRCTFGTGNLMLHRVVFEKVGLFDETFTTRAEDTDLFCRIHALNIETWYVPNAVVQHITHYERLQPSYLERLARHMGASIAQREREHFSSLLFLARWGAKSLRWLCWQVPKERLARIQLRSEEALGLACKNVLAQQYATQGMQLVRQLFIPKLGFFPRLGQRTSITATP